MEVNLWSLEFLPRFEKPMSKIHILCMHNVHIIYICGCTHIHIYYIYTHKQLLALSHLRRLFFLGAPNIGPLTYLGQVGRNPPGNPAGEKKVPPEVVFLFWHRKNWATTKKRFGTLKETYTLKSWSSLDFELNNVFHFKNISPTPIFQDFS